jgi:hypothetical protein
MQHLPFLLRTCSYPRQSAQNALLCQGLKVHQRRDITDVLNYELDKWKNRLPQEFRPGHVIKPMKNPLLWHVVMLHFLYHNCVMMANRSRSSSKSGADPNTTDPRVSSSMTSRINAARNTISLLKQVPKGNQIRIW